MGVGLSVSGVLIKCQWDVGEMLIGCQWGVKVSMGC